MDRGGESSETINLLKKDNNIGPLINLVIKKKIISIFIKYLKNHCHDKF